MHNTGGRALDLSGELSLSAVTGSIVAGPYPLDESPTLAPGESLAITFAPTVPQTPGTAEPALAAEATGGITWWVAALAVLATAGLALVAAIVAARRRRRSVATDVT